ncbi:pimeloyl-ACP methyl ester carboxylesterase [Actinopolyspora lacussalsi]|uniref:Pimeloyl-ACP methyl ester carboxylesterase n=1 Tax=Actinopolyspora righensis TaxID=995060 RepID=A0A1I6YGE7_9ACTN|nr:alpha/beta hydrolase [Actinopolyspora righensis]MDP9644193.1 pimeloyl-ACP methyl ester carboxylesterase [Actinopolyspora lacussalsi]SFT49482.1 Pimeloyl-ACP methyl ester carboxylesterase [Actinopolyspora righensis]
MNVQYVEAAGKRVPVRIEGEGPGLLLVHGTGATGDANFGHLLESFTPDHTTIVPDYAGSDDDTADPGEFALDQLVEQVVAAARAAELDEPVDVVGYSLGAVVTAAAAAKYPNLFRRVVLVAGWVTMDPRQRLVFDLWRRLADTDPQAYSRFVTMLLFTRSFMNGLGDAGLEEAASGTGFTPATLRQIDLNSRIDISDSVGDVVAPTLVIGCSHDQLIPVEHARQLHQAIGQSDYVELESGHLVVVEKSDELVKHISEFLK